MANLRFAFFAKDNPYYIKTQRTVSNLMLQKKIFRRQSNLFLLTGCYRRLGGCKALIGSCFYFHKHNPAVLRVCHNQINFTAVAVKIASKRPRPFRLRKRSLCFSPHLPSILASDSSFRLLKTKPNNTHLLKQVVGLWSGSEFSSEVWQ